MKPSQKFDQIRHTKGSCMNVTVNGYAKINLFLDIVSLRENGYHNILSLMQRISLCDTVSVNFTAGDEKSITVTCDDPRVPTGTDNLVYKAANVFPLIGKIEIHIEKRIPMSAGLAGGSADAAATLIALNTLASNKLSDDELKALGAKLGADIPFCIEGGAAIVTGIGEVMTPTAKMPHLPIVIAKMGEGMSTPQAYRALDQRFDSFRGYEPKEALLSLLTDAKDRENVDTYCQGLFNIFEAVVEPIRPAVTELKQTMLRFGAKGAMMSGSGTSVFGIFRSEEEAREAVSELIRMGAEAHLCYPT